MKTPFVWACRLFMLPAAALFTDRVEGRENIPEKENFIAACNHINSLDYWFIGNVLKRRLRRLRFVAALDSIRTAAQSGLLYYFSEPIIINRKTGDRKVILKKMMDSLKSGDIIVLFPEGDTNRRKELLKGKTGVAELALRSGRPVLPIGLRRLPRSTRRVVSIGKPLNFSKREEDKKNDERYYEVLRKTTNTIMRKISMLSKKPYNHGD
jgi:1-acyl-sn-glycerol-3-phosphate acyltransferase